MIPVIPADVLLGLFACFHTVVCKASPFCVTSLLSALAQRGRTSTLLFRNTASFEEFACLCCLLLLPLLPCSPLSESNRETEPSALQNRELIHSLMRGLSFEKDAGLSHQKSLQ